MNEEMQAPTNQKTPAPNGNAHPIDPSTMEAIRERFHAELSDKVKTILGVTVTGIMMGFAGAAPRVVMPIIARHMGMLLTGSVRGDLPSLLELRREVKKAFAEGVASVDLGKQQDVKAPPPPRRPV